MIPVFAMAAVQSAEKLIEMEERLKQKAIIARKKNKKHSGYLFDSEGDTKRH